MIFLIVVIFAVGAAILYVSIGNTPPTTPQGTKVAELARVVFAACAFAIFFALTFGYVHDVLVKVVK